MARSKSHVSASKETPPKKPTTRELMAPREEVVEFIRNRTICYKFAVGIACNPKGCSYVHNHVPAGYYRHVEHQSRKAATPLDEPTTLTRARR